MSSFIKIENPCKESWGNMHEISGGRFCDLCSKKVWDLTEKSDEEIEKILGENPKICGRINRSKLNIASSILIAVSLTSISCTHQVNVQNNAVENVLNKKVIIKGEIDSLKKGVREAHSIKLITKSKLYYGSIDSNNRFEIEVPESSIQQKNILKISYHDIYKGELTRGSSMHLLTQKDLFQYKTLHADDGLFEIGAVIVSAIELQDFYFFDGKNISKNKFETLVKENSSFEEIVLYDEPYAKAIVKDPFVGNVYLLYSK